MSFSYTPGSTADADRVRLEIQDIDSSQPLFEDAEITDLLTQEGSVLGAAARAAEMLSMRYARHYDFTADGATFRKSSVSKMYADMARRLRARTRGTVVSVPTRVDGYSDDVRSDEVTHAGNKSDFDRGVFP